MTRSLAICALLMMGACTGPSEGTFIGNPSLTAAIAPADTQLVRSGRLVASEVFLRPCGTGDVALGAVTWQFDGFQSNDRVQFEPGTYCETFLIVQELTVRFDDGGTEVRSVTAGGFDITIPGDLTAAEGDRFELLLASAGWLDRLAAVTEPGDSLLDGTNPDLESAFYEGLQEESSVGAPSSPTPPPDEPLPGRLDLEGYPTSPLGTPSSATGCGPGVELNLAVPIPHAAMATLGLGDGQVGWCEGAVRFDDDLSARTSIQQDYSDLSTYPVSYNGWGQGCSALHCNQITSFEGVVQDRACTVLAFCDGAGLATVTGFAW